MPPNAGSRRFKCHSTLRPSADNAAATRSAPPAAQLLGDAGWSIPRNKGASNWAPQLLRNPCCLSFCPKAHTHACVARQVPTHAPTRLCWRPQSRHREGIAVAAGSRRAAPSRFARSPQAVHIPKHGIYHRTPPAARFWLLRAGRRLHPRNCERASTQDSHARSRRVWRPRRARHRSVACAPRMSSGHRTPPRPRSRVLANGPGTCIEAGQHG